MRCPSRKLASMAARRLKSERKLLFCHNSQRVRHANKAPNGRAFYVGKLCASAAPNGQRGAYVAGAANRQRVDALAGGRNCDLDVDLLLFANKA